MRKLLVALLVLASAPALAQQSVPEIPFDSVPNFLKLPPDLYIGEPTGVAVNSKGHVFVFSRGGSSTGPAYAETAAQLLEFAPDGKYIREIGKNLYAWSFAHSVRIDKQDNIWAVDKGSDMIVKFNPEGRVMFVSGRKQEASDEGTGPLKHPNPPLPAVDGRYRQPTDVTWDSVGNAYISDGYIDSRIAKLDKDGNFIGSWGSHGTGPGQFNTPHSIGADAENNIYVADRGNRRVQVFDTAGNFLRQFTIDVPPPPDARMVIGDKYPDPTGADVPSLLKPGAPWVICITPPPHQFLYTADAFPGRIYKLTLDGKLVGMLGHAGKELKAFGWIHAMACPDENTLIVGEIINWRVQKLILHPERAAAR